MVNLARIISKKSPNNFFNENGYEGYFDKYPKIGLVYIRIHNPETNVRFSETYKLESDKFHIKIAKDMAKLNPSPFKENEDLDTLAERIKLDIQLS
ncbi:hypothetical protein ACIQV0_19125 [Lysinibacillus capsici]|uniref:hypothetical protein n=1 Tax=Lysinibacillus capsici TaxID=2115968 RepID=UPI003817E6EE